MDEVTWTTKNQWWNAGAAATFNIAGPFSAVAGFMVDSFTTNFSSPSNFVAAAVQTENDELDLTVSTVIPYLGGLLTQGGPAGSLTIGMIGFPILFGDAKFTHSWTGGPAANTWGAEIAGGINSGYFFEIFAETAVNIRAMSFGIFGGWSTTHAKMDMDYDTEGRTSGAVTDGDTQPHVGSFYRSVWMVGGKFALDFVSPL